MVEEEAREAEEVDEERVWGCVPTPSSCPTPEVLIRPAVPLLLLLLPPKVAGALRGLVGLVVVDLPALPTKGRGWGAAVGVGIGALNTALGTPVTGDGASGARREAATASFSSAAAAATAVARRWRWGRKTMLVGG